MCDTGPGGGLTSACDLGLWGSRLGWGWPVWALPLFRDVVLQAGSLMPTQVGGLLDFLFYPHLRLGVTGTGEWPEF